MLKRLAILAMLLVVAQASMPVPGQTANRSALVGSGIQSNGAHENSNSRPPASTIPENNAGNSHVEGTRHSSENDQQTVTVSKFPPVSVSKDWADWAVWWFTGALVLVGALQGAVMWRQVGLLKGTLAEVHAQAEWMKTQAGHMKDQTEILKGSVAAAKDSAKAANDQIKMMKDKERARVAVEILQLTEVTFGTAATNRVTIKFRNFGPTNAYKVLAEADARAIIKAFEPLPIDSAGLSIPTVMLPGPPATESWVSFWFLDEWVDEFLLRPKIALQLRGSIAYDDVFGDGHVTNFSYEMRIPHLIGPLEDLTVPLKIHPFSRWYQTKEGNDSN